MSVSPGTVCFPFSLQELRRLSLAGDARERGAPGPPAGGGRGGRRGGGGGRGPGKSC